MASVKQIEANRKNAQQSTGPKTDAGKDASRLNALKHGLCTEVLDVLPDEDPRKFADRLNAWIRDLAPTTEAEATLVRQAAILSWRLDRADRFEVASLSMKMLEAIEACELNDTSRIVRTAALASFDASSEGERLRRYQFALIRELRRTMDAFAKLKKQAVAPKEADRKEASGRDAHTTSETIISAPNEPNLARRGSPDPAATTDRRSPQEDQSLMPADRQSTPSARLQPQHAAPNEPNFPAKTPIGRNVRGRKVVDLDAAVSPGRPVTTNWRSVSCERR